MSRGRFETPQRFTVKAELKENANVTLWEKNYCGLIWFGVDDSGYLWLDNERSKSNCIWVSNVFEGIQDTTLTGKTRLEDEDEHHCARMVAVQLE